MREFNTRLQMMRTFGMSSGISLASVILSRRLAATDRIARRQATEMSACSGR